MKALPLLSVLVLASPVVAQAPIWEEDFNVSGINPLRWTQTYNAAYPWSVTQSGGFLNLEGFFSLTAPLGETYELEATLPNLTGAFTMFTYMEWDEGAGAGGPGWSQFDTEIELQDAAGTSLGKIKLWDSNSLGPEGSFWGGGGVAVASYPAESEAFFELYRDSAGQWGYRAYSLNGNTSWTLGNNATTVSKLVIRSTVWNAGNATSPTGPSRIDFIRIWDGGAPTLNLTGACGQQMTATLANMTPGGIAVVAYGTAGQTMVPGGPCAGLVVPLGGAKRYVNLIADAQGNASVSGNVPLAACGVFRVIGADAATCTLTNIEYLY